MLMGPVFRAELLRTSRQRRYYVLRFLYAGLLLLLVWSGYEQMQRLNPVVHLSDVATFAEELFIAFAIAQLATVLLLIPAIFGGAIADEKQRKTLHYMMASQLSSFEIILDKVLGRSALLVTFVAVGLPIVGLLGLFGGISLDSVVFAYVGTFSTAAFAIAMTVLISTLARRVRDAILSAYVLMLMWLFVPPLVRLFGRAIRPSLYFWIQPVNDWLADTSPLGLTLRPPVVVVRSVAPPPMTDPFPWMVGYQLAGAVVLLLIAIVRLRPTFRRHEETPTRRARAGRRRRWSAHPECGDDPVLWKERYFAPVDRFTRVVLLPAIVFITLPLALMTEVEGELFRVLKSFWQRGYAARHSLPASFLWALQIDLGWYAAFWLLAVAGASASCMTVEREKDTWVSLTATPLTGREILRGKFIGAIWNQRGFAAVLIFLWALAILTGAAHPLGIVFSIALIVLFTWFVASLGAYASLRASNTSRRWPPRSWPSPASTGIPSSSSSGSWTPSGGSLRTPSSGRCRRSSPGRWSHRDPSSRPGMP